MLTREMPSTPRLLNQSTSFAGGVKKDRLPIQIEHPERGWLAGPPAERDGCSKSFAVGFEGSDVQDGSEEEESLA